MPASETDKGQDKTPDPGFGLYFHWPFCRKKCPYCDFNSHVRETVDQKIWTKALLAELAWFAERSDRRPVSSIFFGGGTPSLMEPATVEALIDGVAQHFPVDETIEISLEANPTSAEAEFFEGYRTAGVNRLSMGVQSLRDPFLAFLGREHSASEARKTIELARARFPSISFDLIYALPDQSLADWENDLKEALALAGDHLSLYQLTIEPNTGFAGSYKRGEFDLPVDEVAESMFERTQEICGEAGMQAYEISNHAKPGFECRHNLTYWRYGAYLGIGPGAHGRVLIHNERWAFQQRRKPESWLKQVQETGSGTEESRCLADWEERAEEALLMGLRLREGVWFQNFENATGRSFTDCINSQRLTRLQENGFLEVTADYIRATDKGRFVLNSILAELMA